MGGVREGKKGGLEAIYFCDMQPLDGRSSAVLLPALPHYLLSGFKFRGLKVTKVRGQEAAIHQVNVHPPRSAASVQR